VLRITTERSKNLLSLRLEGRIAGPWVEVLRRTWTDAASRDEPQEIVLDFGGVSFVDNQGQKLLLTMQKRGVMLINPSGFMREVLERHGPSLKHNKSRE
jgi:anti-anti-sigma factor